MDGFENRNLCRACGGICCKNLPGIVYPEDVRQPMFDNLLIMLTSGNYAIDWWEDDPESMHFLRPAIKGDARICSPSWVGECVFLSTNGCKLVLRDRPRGCRMLEPREGPCDSHGHTKLHGGQAWQEYEDILMRAAKQLLEAPAHLPG